MAAQYVDMVRTSQPKVWLQESSKHSTGETPLWRKTQGRKIWGLPGRPAKAGIAHEATGARRGRRAVGLASIVVRVHRPPGGAPLKALLRPPVTLGRYRESVHPQERQIALVLRKL
jgi:hypothetical protein